MPYSCPCRSRTRRNSRFQRSLSLDPRHTLYNISICSLLSPRDSSPLCIGKYPAASAIAPTSTPMRGPRLSMIIPAGIPMAYAPTFPAAPFALCYLLLQLLESHCLLSRSIRLLSSACESRSQVPMPSKRTEEMLSESMLRAYASTIDIHWFRKRMQCQLQPPQTLSGLFSSDLTY